MRYGLREEMVEPTPSGDWGATIAIVLSIVICLVVFIWIFIELNPYMSDFISGDQTPTIDVTPAEGSPETR
jgi:hypothetical protein